MQALDFPAHIDDAPLILIWTWDEVLPFLALLFIGVVTANVIKCIILGAIFMKLYTKFRAGKPVGFIYHLCYWHGCFPEKAIRTIPDAFSRHYMP